MKLRQLGNAFFYEKERKDCQEIAGIAIKVSGVLNSPAREKGVNSLLDDFTMCIPYTQAENILKEVDNNLLQEELIKAMMTWKSFIDDSKGEAIKVPEELMLSRKFITNYFNINNKTFAALLHL